VGDANVASWAQGRRWNAFISVFVATALVGLIALVVGQTPVAAVAGLIWFGGGPPAHVPTVAAARRPGP
jgi:hypothetical protein